MIRFEKVQIKALETDLEDRFVDRLTSEFRRDLPGPTQDATQDELRPYVAMAVEDARAFGLETEADLRSFAMLALLLGTFFHEHPAIAGVLEDPSIAPEHRIDRLLGTITSHQWAEARQIGLEDAM